MTILTDAEIDAIECSLAGPSPERERHIDNLIATARFERQRADEQANERAAWQQAADLWMPRALKAEQSLAEQAKLLREADAVIEYDSYPSPEKQTMLIRLTPTGAKS